MHFKVVSRCKANEVLCPYCDDVILVKSKKVGVSEHSYVKFKMQCPGSLLKTKKRPDGTFKVWTKFDNDKFYETYEFDDETSPSDPQGRWVGGCDYHSRTYYCRILKSILKTDDERKIQDFIDKNTEEIGFWR